MIAASTTTVAGMMITAIHTTSNQPFYNAGPQTGKASLRTFYFPPVDPDSTYFGFSAPNAPFFLKPQGQTSCSFQVFYRNEHR
jgi:hypothetical protein